MKRIRYIFYQTFLVMFAKNFLSSCYQCLAINIHEYITLRYVTLYCVNATVYFINDIRQSQAGTQNN